MAFGETLGLNFKITADSADAQKSVDALKARLSAFLQELRGHAKALAGLNTKAITTDFSALDKQAGQLATTLGGKLPSNLQGVTSLLTGLSGATALATTAGVALGAGMFTLASETAAYGVEVSKAAKATNLSTDAIQALGREAEATGGSMGGAVGAVQTFIEKIGDARDGNKELAAAFRAVGVDIKNFHQTTEQALDVVLRRFAALPPGIERSTLASKLFGDEGARVILSMRGTEQGIASLIERYKDLGLVVSEQGTKEAAKFEKTMRDLRNSWEAFKRSIGGPVLEGFNEMIRGTRIEMDAIASAWRTLQALGRSRKERELFKDIADIPPPTAPTVKPGRTLSQLQELIFGTRADAKKSSVAGSGIDRDLTQLELQMNRLQRLAEDTRTAFSASLDAIREKFKDDLGAEEFFQELVQEEQRFVEQQKALIAQERALILARPDPPRRKIDNLEQLAARESQVINQSSERIIAASRQVDSALEAAEERRARLIQKETDDLNRSKEQWARYANDVTGDLIKIHNAEVDLKEATDRRRKAADDAAAAGLREVFRGIQRQDSFSARSQFGDTFADTLDDTGSRIKAMAAGGMSALQELQASVGTFGSIGKEALFGVADAAKSTLANFILTGKGGALAFKQLAAGVIAALVQMSVVNAVVEIAKGFSALASPLTAAEAPGHFLAAAKWAAAAAIGGAVAVAIGASGGLAGSSGGGGGSFGGSSESDQRRSDFNQTRGDVTGQLGGEPGAFNSIAFAIEKHVAATERLTAKLSSMRPGDVITAAADNDPSVFGDALVKNLQSSGYHTRQIGMAILGPA